MLPHEWWEMYGSSVPTIQRAAMRLVSLPSSSSTTERTWSNYDYIHTKRRNRLTARRAEKLIFVYGHERTMRAAKARAAPGKLPLRWGATEEDWQQPSEDETTGYGSDTLADDEDEADD